MYPAFVGVAISWPEWNALRPHVLFSFAALEGIFRLQVLGASGSTVLPSLIVRQQTWQEFSKLGSSSLDCRCGNRFSDFQAWRLCQASCAAHQAVTGCGKSGGR